MKGGVMEAGWVGRTICTQGKLDSRHPGGNVDTPMVVDGVFVRIPEGHITCLAQVSKSLLVAHYRKMLAA